MQRTVDIAATAAALALEGRPFVLATVVRAEAPTSVRPGAKAIIHADGTVDGWIGGSCSEPNVVRHARRVLGLGQPELLRIGPDELEPPHGVTGLTTTCPSGGTVDIFLEPVLPVPQVVVVGHTPVARAAARIAEATGYRVVEVDGRRGVPDLAASGVQAGAHAIVASMGHYDEDAIVAALAAGAVSVALVASSRRAAAALELLRERGLPDELLARVERRPGVELGETTQEEIALSLVAGVVRRLRHAPATSLPAGSSAPAWAPETAIDPTSGAVVEILPETPSAEHDGVTYWFTCSACRNRFVRDPARFLTAPGA